MIGSFKFGGDQRAVLADDGTWSLDPDDPELKPIAELLNARFNPNRPDTADHHRPFGVKAVCEAANFFKAEAEIAVKPFPPLPPDTVS